MELDAETMNNVRASLGIPPLTRWELVKLRRWDKITGVPLLAPESETAAQDGTASGGTAQPEADTEQPAVGTAQPAVGDGVSLAGIGASLRAAREEYGMSLGELEDETGMSRGRLSRIETGAAPNPTIDTLARIAAALSLEIVVTFRPSGTAA